MLLIQRGRKNNFGGLLMAPIPAPRSTQRSTQNSTRSPRLTLSKLARSLRLLFSKVAVLAAIVSRNLHKNNKKFRAKSADLPRPFPSYSPIPKKSAEEATSPFINFKNRLLTSVKIVFTKMSHKLPN